MVYRTGHRDAIFNFVPMELQSTYFQSIKNPNFFFAQKILTQLFTVQSYLFLGTFANQSYLFFGTFAKAI